MAQMLPMTDGVYLETLPGLQTGKIVPHGVHTAGQGSWELELAGKISLKEVDIEPGLDS